MRKTEFQQNRYERKQNINHHKFPIYIYMLFLLSLIDIIVEKIGEMIKIINGFTELRKDSNIICSYPN